MEKIVFGGGCFWCTEVLFLSIKGVISVTPGYAGGNLANPNYDMVSGGNTGHAEVILIEYDSEIIKLEKLLDIFFDSHDPTTLNKQGNDIGTQYRSILLYSTKEQFETIKSYISKIENLKIFKGPITTEVTPLINFYPAEEYHKKYYEKHPNESYSKFIIEPKIKKLKEHFSNYLK